jgi:thioester reductase-like protein
VFPNGVERCEEDADISTFSDKLTDGYSQSKWVAEQIITGARKRGIPAAVYRLGISIRNVLPFKQQSQSTSTFPTDDILASILLKVTFLKTFILL